jgi:hypothetical protein
MRGLGWRRLGWFHHQRVDSPPKIREPIHGAERVAGHVVEICEFKAVIGGGVVTALHCQAMGARDGLTIGLSPGASHHDIQ